MTIKAAVKAIVVEELKDSGVEKNTINSLIRKICSSFESFKSVEGKIDYVQENKINTKDGIFDPRPDAMKNKARTIALSSSGDGVSSHSK